MSNSDEVKTCPYCGAKLKHPYWSHVQKNHPDEYAKKQTWIPLFKDYKKMGMENTICYKVIGELFNVEEDEVEFFLKQNNVI
jgi:hypothetical protein